MTPSTRSIAPTAGPSQPARSTRSSNVSRLRFTLTAPNGKRWTYMNGQIHVNGVRYYTEEECRGVRLTLHSPRPRPIKAITSTYTHRGDTYRVIKGTTYRNGERYLTENECRGKRVKLNPPKEPVSEVVDDIEEKIRDRWSEANGIECDFELRALLTRRRARRTRSRNVDVERRHAYEAYGAC